MPGGSAAGFDNRSNVQNLEDSEDPAQDSYASPDVNRQLPFSSNHSNHHEALGMSNGGGAVDGSGYGMNQNMDVMRTPAVNNRLNNDF